MAARAPKQWPLTRHETITSFENWRQNLECTLSLDPNFSKFLERSVTWTKKTADNPLRGFTDDSDSVPESLRLTAVQQAAQLELMLGQIANFCPVISRNTIVKNSTSLSAIWQAIRLHFGFQSTGAHLLDFASIRREHDERPEDLFQRLMAFVEDTLLTTDAGISHHGVLPSTNEDMSPTLENLVCLHWLSLLHTGLPALVKQRYGPELRCRTLASLKPEISQSLASLMDELRSAEDAQVLRSAAASFSRAPSRPAPTAGRTQPPAGTAAGQPRTAAAAGRSAAAAAAGGDRRTQRPARSCALCKAAGRPESDSHFLSRCRFLPASDRRSMAGIRLIAGCDVDADFDEPEDDDPVSPTPADEH
ncbi:uncharacterized protein LOC122363584 [Amphibalanus amphitrite]|uniref:uncharacterized protein LOC122363584 n=1 Tax=Amphibalanus amphitrite TaxID=1232801 RepID=UPI001C91142B|nr:uncharacterized protein LOC122363584 [Amphibalanus amphitrite]